MRSFECCFLQLGRLKAHLASVKRQKAAVLPGAATATALQVHTGAKQETTYSSSLELKAPVTSFPERKFLKKSVPSRCEGGDLADPPIGNERRVERANDGDSQHRAWRVHPDVALIFSFISNWLRL